MFRRITGGIISAAILVSSLGVSGMTGSSGTVSAASTPNYAEALQKSLYFYEVQQAGPLPEWNRVEWRADSTMTDEIKGGWYDAGDHVKFNLPMAYSASMLAWGLYQYPDGIEKCGEMTNYVNNLEYALDYFVNCDLGSSVVYQVGNGTVDHTWWGPVELYEYGMSDSGTSIDSARATLKASDGCCAVFGEMAAALAAGAAALDGRISSSKTASYIEHAEHLFELAAASPDDSVYNDSNASGFYRSSHCYDQLLYAADWLYIATNDSKYLDLATSYLPKQSRMLGEETSMAYGWSHCWDDNLQGAMLLYAIITGDADAITHVQKHLNFWLTSDQLKTVPGGMRWLTNWGCLRYAATTGFLASVACDTVLSGDTSKYKDFYETQINFILGDNPNNFSYVCGYGENYPHNPHHRTAHASWKNAEAYPVMSRHILYGALVGGPNSDGTYEDDRGNYINNEVATDYNAGYTALLCAMTDKYGGTTDPNFPEKEVHDGPEFYVETTFKTNASSGATISFKVTNHSAWPARVQDNISFRYYMDLSEIKAAGKKPEDVVVRCDRDQSAMYSGKGIKSAEISDIMHYDGDIYYVEVNLPDGRAVVPVSEGMQQCEILLAFVFPDYGNGWNAENDFSNKELLGASSTTDAEGKAVGIVSPYVPVYVNGDLYYGYEPDGTYADGLGGTGSDSPVTTTAPKTTTSTTTTTAPTDITTTSQEILVGPTGGTDKYLAGDANEDGDVNMADSVAIMRSQADPDEFSLTEQGRKNADVTGGSDGVTNSDALVIQKYEAGIVTSLPVD